MRILVLGFTFKENCPDVRNTRVIDIVNMLKEYETDCEIYDPWADPAEVYTEYQTNTIKDYEQLQGAYDAIIIAVAHRQFLTLDFAKLKRNNNSVIYDIKGLLSSNLVDGRL
jgi:UDP-N-acetyl-D-galactosamine dehydrogenase